MIAHNIGLSIGNAGSFDLEYVSHMGEWQDRYRFPWQSDHLSFAEVTTAEGQEHHAGIAVPLPYDREVLELIAGRVEQVRRVIGVPFLLENSVYFISFEDQDMSEPEFLNALTRGTGCGVLLDIHNLYANARNHGFDARRFLRELDLSTVVEAHIAGGTEFAGMYTDSHSGPCPEPVWELLGEVAEEAANLRAVTFEFHDSYYSRLGADGIRKELNRAREIFHAVV